MSEEKDITYWRERNHSALRVTGIRALAQGFMERKDECDGTIASECLMVASLRMAELEAELAEEKKKNRPWSDSHSREVIDGQAATIKRLEGKLNGWFIQRDNLKDAIRELITRVLHRDGCRRRYNENCDCGWVELEEKMTKLLEEKKDENRGQSS